MLRGLRVVARGARSGAVRELQPRAWASGHVRLGTLVAARSDVVVGRARPAGAGTAVMWRRQLSAAKKSGEEMVIKVPEMGESIKDGTVASWLKNVGDKVEEDDIICQVETDKITADVRAPKAGTITALLAEIGDTVDVNQDLIKMNLSTGDDAAEAKPEATPVASEAAPPQESPAGDSMEDAAIKVPEMGESITEGTIISWFRSPGETFNEDDILAQLETDKITVDVRAPKSGVLKEQLFKEGDTVQVGEVMASVAYGAVPEGAGATQAPAEEPSTPASSTPPPPPPPASVSEPSRGQGMEDVTKKLEQMGKIQSGERRVAMTRMRRRIAERLKEAQNTAAMLTTFNEVDMSALMNLRNDYKDDFLKKHNVKLGFMSAFVKASGVALLEQPDVNAFIDGGDVVYRDYVDISVAVSTPTGLVVPAIRGCERMSFADIEKTIFQLGEKAKNGALTLDELQGGTFTISNGGIFGSLLSTPIINMPQSAILGMHAIQKRPVAVNDQVVIRPMMYLALSYDHRLIDGKEAVTFLRRIKTLIEDPRRLLLNIDL